MWRWLVWLSQVHRLLIFLWSFLFTSEGDLEFYYAWHCQVRKLRISSVPCYSLMMVVLYGPTFLWSLSFLSEYNLNLSCLALFGSQVPDLLWSLIFTSEAELFGFVRCTVYGFFLYLLFNSDLFGFISFTNSRFLMIPVIYNWRWLVWFCQVYRLQISYEPCYKWRWRRIYNVWRFQFCRLRISYDKCYTHLIVPVIQKWWWLVVLCQVHRLQIYYDPCYSPVMVTNLSSSGSQTQHFLWFLLFISDGDLFDFVRCTGSRFLVYPSYS